MSERDTEIGSSSREVVATSIPSSRAAPSYPRVNHYSFRKWATSGTNIIANESFKFGHFVDANGKELEFDTCDFSFCIFERAYFHKTKFRNCAFVGTKFKDSNLRQAIFSQCDLRYAEFSSTILETREVVASLPLEANLRVESLRNLQRNAISISDHQSRPFLVIQEIMSSRDHYIYALRGSDGYYRDKYPSVLDKLRVAGHLAGHYVSGFVWGHGERPIRVALSILAMLALATFINFWSVLYRVSWQDTAGGLYVFKYVVDLFLDFSPDLKFSGFVFVDYFLVIARYVYIGIFISILYKQVSYRS